MEKINLNEAIKLISSVNLKFTEVLNDLPSDVPSIYYSEYSFGDLLSDDQTFYFNIDGSLTNHTQLPRKIMQEFSLYNGNIPFGIVLDKSMEYFVDTSEHTIPGRVFKKGDPFGFDNQLGEQLFSVAPPVYQVTSGARSCFCVSNLGNSTNFRAIKRELKSKLSAPKHIYQHHNLFRLLYNNSRNKNVWKLKVIFFSHEWLKKINTDKSFSSLRLYLYSKYWERNEIARSRAAYDYMSSSVFTQMKSRKPDPYIMAVIRSFILLIINAFPGYTVLNDNQLLPIDHLKLEIESTYKLGTNSSFVGPSYFSSAKTLYYTLSYPPTMLFTKIYAQHQTTVNRLDEIREIADHFFNIIRTTDYCNSSLLSRILKQTDIRYFHTHPDQFSKIEQSNKLLLYDEMLQENVRNKMLPKTSQFIRGLIGFRSNE